MSDWCPQASYCSTGGLVERTMAYVHPPQVAAVSDEIGQITGLVVQPDRLLYCLPARRVRESQNINQNGPTSGSEMCFAIGSQHFWFWGQNASRIQHKEG